MTYVLSRKEKINGYWMNVGAMFSMADACGEKRPCVTRYINNDRGTYSRNLGTRFFNSKEDGNEFYKQLLSQGYKLVNKF